jgi:hypothetical protein
MSSVAKEKIKVYETVLSSPGMGDKCKVVLHLSRQNILLLSRLIETGLNSGKENPDELIGLLSNESREELETVVPEFLKKGGLTEFYEKLKSL